VALETREQVQVMEAPRAASQVVVGIVQSLRPKQWTKNGIVFAGLVFSRNLFVPELFLRTTLAFVLFCLVSGAVYLINDLADLEKDRRHPVKRHRPLAAGVITPWQGAVAAALLLAISLPAAFALTPRLALALLAYLLLQLAYSFKLKHIVLLDVLVIAGGFVLRAVGGAWAINVPISPWLYVCTILLALFLGLAKRRHELLLLEENAANHRRILDEYSTPLLNDLLGIVSSATIMAYSLYTFSADNLPRNHAMMLTIPFVIYGIFRYMYLVHRRNEGGSPESVLLKDVPLIVTILLWGITSLTILHFVR
jgi:4-hydroxybenzoate polyprenyltransferase